MPSFTTSDGTRLHYELVGTGAPLICVPGGPGRAAAYLEDLGGLARQHTLVLLDPRGTGGSAMPSDAATLAYPALAGDLEELRRHLRVETIDLLGHSAGAVVAEVYAARNPARLRRLVLANPSARLQGVSPDTSAVRTARYAEAWYSDAAQAMAALDAVTSLDEAAPLLNRVAPFYYGRWTPHAKAHAAGYQRQVSRGAQVSFTAGPLIRDFDRVGTLAALLAVQAPVLVIAGSLDGGSGIPGAEAVAASFSTARVAVMEGCGHYPWVDAPAEFASLVDRFLGS
jgi:pimeloyl-ACP methyl ester carboxylesterase